MKINTVQDIIDIENKLREDFLKENKKVIHYPILFKKAVMQFVETNKICLTQLSGETGIKYNNLMRWKGQYQEGLYEPDGAYCVSKRSKKTNKTILDVLQQQLVEIQDKITLIKQCQALGLTVTEASKGK